MGLAPYGEPRYVDVILDKLIDLREDGSYRLDTSFFGYLDSEAATNAAFEELFGCKRRDPESHITIEYMDIAASARRSSRKRWSASPVARCATRRAATSALPAGSR